MTADVIHMKTGKRILTPDQVLEHATGEFKALMLLGWDIGGELQVEISTQINKGDMLWLLEKVKHKLMAGDYD